MGSSESDSVALDRAVFRLLITSFENELAPTVLKCELDLIYELLQYWSLPSSTELLNSIGIYYKDENVATRALHVLRRAKEWEKASSKPTEHEKAAVLPEEKAIDTAIGSDLDFDEESGFRKVYRLDEEEAGEPEASAEEGKNPFEGELSEDGGASEPDEAPAFEEGLDESVFEQEADEAETEEASAEEEENPFEEGVVEEGLDESVFEEGTEAETEEASAEEEENPFEERFSEDGGASEPDEAPAFEEGLDESVFEQEAAEKKSEPDVPPEEEENPFEERFSEESGENEDKHSSASAADGEDATAKLRLLKDKYLNR